MVRQSNDAIGKGFSFIVYFSRYRHWQRCRMGSETPPQRHRTPRMEEACPLDE